MGIFSKKSKTAPDPSFSEEQKISNGNLFEVAQKLRAQKEIDLRYYVNSQNVDNKIVQMIDNQMLNAYWLLELQTNYFANSFNYEIEDMNLYQKIKMMIRVAFKNGIAGIYKVKDNYLVVAISNLETDHYQNVIKAKAININNSNIDFTESTLKNFAEYEINDVENLCVFKWGSAGLSAWITIYKLCLIQQDLLTMINVDKFSYLKKLVHIVNDPSSSSQEVDDYFNIYKPFLKKLKGTDLKNRIEVIAEAQNSNPNVLIEFYKQTMGIYYAIYGRRTNNDYKKERSITQEIGLTSDNYKILEKDWIDEFKVFAYNFKKQFNMEIKVFENNDDMQDISNGAVRDNLDGGSDEV